MRNVTRRDVGHQAQGGVMSLHGVFCDGHRGLAPDIGRALHRDCDGSK
jgi:hypothetical protein